MKKLHTELMSLIAEHAPEIAQGSVRMNEDGSWSFTIVTKPTAVIDLPVEETTTVGEDETIPDKPARGDDSET